MTVKSEAFRGRTDVTLDVPEQLGEVSNVPEVTFRFWLETAVMLRDLPASQAQEDCSGSDE